MQILPIIDQILTLYEMPLNNSRFERYLQLLEGGSKGSFKLPIQFFNPMAKSHIRVKLMEMKEIGIEQIMKEVMQDFDGLEGNLIFNLADDVAGGWTNLDETDAMAKRPNKTMLQKKFCIVLFFASEEINTALIKNRTEESIKRYQLQIQNANQV